MKCRKFQRDLSAYLDGEASEDLKARMEEHLGGCALCRREVELARKADGLLGVMEVSAPSEAFVQGVMGKIGREAKEPERVRWIAPASRRAFVFATAAALLIAVGAFLLARGQRQGAPPATTAELEMFSQMELLANLDVLENFEELQMLDDIEELLADIPGTGETNS